MSITFTDESYVRTNNNTVIWDNQTSGSTSFFFRYETSGSSSGSVINGCEFVGRFNFVGMSTTLVPGGSSGYVNVRFSVTSGGADYASYDYSLAVGTIYHIAVTHAPGYQFFWINGIANQFGAGSFATQPSINVPFAIGGTPQGSPCVYTINDVAVWNGYTLTETDVTNLRDGLQTPSQIGVTASGRWEWTLAGTIATSPAYGDAGLANNYGDSTHNLITVGGAGSAVYSPPLSFTPSVGIQTAYVATSGKTVAVFFESLATSTPTTPLAVTTAPTITINGANQGSLTNLWLTGYHGCLVYCLPSEVVANPGDSVTLTAPTGWANTSAGVVQAISNVPISNMAGRSAFGTESLARTLRIGTNFSHEGTSNRTLYQIPKNWRYRLDSFQSATSTPDGYPTSTPGASCAAGIHNSVSNDLIDSTGQPGLPGLYAVGWDDLNSSGTTFWLNSSDSGNTYTTTVTERTDLQNLGTNGLGHVRVFDVQQDSRSTVAYLDFQLTVYNASSTPQFANLAIYGPGDFSPIAPIVLDKSNPYAFSNIYLDRLMHGLGSTRWIDATIGYADRASQESEPEESRLLTDFTWGYGNHKVNRTIRYTSVRPYSTSVTPYIYSTFLGSPFTATLAQNITTTPAAGTHETYIGYFTNAIAAPIIAGLTLTIDTEIMRVISVSGSDPNATVVIARGAESTTPATHTTASTVYVNNRLAVTGFSMFTGAGIQGNRVQIIDHVTQNPHGLKTGHFVNFSGGWPTITFTDSSTWNESNFNRIALVTGANTFITVWDGASSGPVTLSTTYSYPTIDPSLHYSSWLLTEVGFPQAFVALASGQFPNCDIHVSIPPLASNTLVDMIAVSVRDNFPAGRNVWLEVGDEPWNNIFYSWQAKGWLSNFAYPGNDPYTWWIVRTGQITQRFRDRFNDGGRGRGNEPKCLINSFFVDPSLTSTILSIAQSYSVPIDAIAVAVYVDADSSTASQNAWNAADDEQAIDLWVHDLYYNSSASGWPALLGTQGHLGYINTYNTATGRNCVLYGYEGGIENACPGTHPTERTRDMVYNPNWYIIEKDFYAFLQRSGFYRFNIYSYDIYYVPYGSWGTNWGIYHSIGQSYGRGDGSDGKADNRLCLATPGLLHTKAATTNQDQQNVSVRGQALLHWMQEAGPTKKPRSSLTTRNRSR